MFEKICVILLVNLVFYAKTLCFGYCSDDIPSSQRDEKHPQWKYWFLVLEGHLKSKLTKNLHRETPLDNKRPEIGSIPVPYQEKVLCPQIDHLLTTVLHALVCVGVYLGFGKSDISFLAALLFSVNPTTNQGSVWISGRGYVLSALGMTWALAIPKIGAIFLFIAAYSNAGFLSPVCFIGSQHPWLVAFMPAIWLFYLKNFRKNVKQKMDKEMFVEDKAIKIEKLVLATKTFGFYTLLALIPFKNTFYHSFLQSAAGSGKEKAYSVRDRFFWIGCIFAGGIFYYWLAVPWNMVSFGLLWWCICLAPFLNFFRMSQEIAERYAYLPMIGLMYALASFIMELK